MATLDLALILILAGFAFFGFWFGLIHTLGALLGTLLGTFAAGRLYEPAAELARAKIGGDLNALKVVAFILILTISTRLIGFAFYVAEKFFKLASVIPFVKSIDRLAGAIFGLMEGVVVIGITLYVTRQFPFGEWLQNAIITNSAVARAVMKVAQIVVPLLPESIRNAGGQLF